MAIGNVRLGELLVERKLITNDQLEDAVRQQQSSSLKLGEVLVSRKLITKRELKRTLKTQIELRKTILTTFLCLVPFQFSCASDQNVYLNYQQAQFSNANGQDQKGKLNISFNTVLQGVNYLFSTNENSNLDKYKTNYKPQSTHYDIKFGKDNFSVDMKISF